jgi:hypothetical protein
MATRGTSSFLDLPSAASALRAAGEAHAGRGELRALGFERIARLCGNVGYIDLRLFPAVERGAGAAAAVVDALVDADALIIDLRRNRGGDRATAALLSSFLFDTEAAYRDAEYWSGGGRAWLRSASSAPAARYIGRDVLLLTGADTSPVGTAFARSLQELGRATVIGQTPLVRPGMAPLTPDVAVVEPLALHTAHLAALHRLLGSSASDTLRAELRRAIRYVQHDLRSYAAGGGGSYLA